MNTHTIFKNRNWRTLLSLTIVSGGLLFGSCSKWLDIAPEDSTPAEELFNRGDGFRIALNGIYLNLASDQLYGKELTWGFSSAIAQQYHIRSSGAPYYDAALLEYGAQAPKATIAAIWENGYKIIANSNKLIEAIEKAEPSLFIYGAEEQDLIHGEALAIRALMHLDLFRLFAPAPHKDGSAAVLPYRTSYTPQPQKPTSGTDFMNQVITDLTKARELVRKNDTQTRIDGMMATGAYTPTPFMNARVRFGNLNRIGEEGIFFSNRGSRLNYLAITGLLARAYMYMNDYTHAMEYAQELYEVYYKDKKWIGFTTSEYINPSLNPDGTYGVKKYFDDLLVAFYKKDLLEEYIPTEVERPLAGLEEIFATDSQPPYTDWRLSLTVKKTNDVNSLSYTAKYDDMATSRKGTVPDESKLLPIIRFSEMLHILAEANCRTGNYAKAVDYLSQVRTARGALRTIRLEGLTEAQLMDEIITDYRKEWIAEGELFFLYKRLNIGTVHSATAGKDLDMNARYVLPVPDTELTH